MQINIEGKNFEVEYLKGKSPNKLPILILHGFPDTARSWFSLASYLQELGHDVIVPTLRGYYPSYSPEAIADYELKLLSSDVSGILNFFEIERCIVVGHDWGGILAWHFAHLNHRRIEKLITLSVPHPVIFKSLLSKDPRQWIKSWYMFIFQIPNLGEYVLAQHGFKNLKKALNSGCDIRHFTETELSDFEKNWKSAHQLKTMIHWYRALKINFDTSDYHKLQMPCLQIIGNNDPFFVKEAFFKKCSLVQIQETKIIEGCGHWPHFEQGSQLKDIIFSFIGN